MDGNLYATLVELAKIGSAGVGVAIFLMVFILLVRGKPVDEHTAQLREKFLKWGVLFAVFCGVVALLPPMMQKESGPLAMRLSFSPDFESQKLSPPKVILPDGSNAEAEKFFKLRPSTEPQVLTVRMDATLNEVRALRDASKKLAESVGSAQQQISALAFQARTPIEVRDSLEMRSNESRSLQAQLTESLRLGDYGKANVLSGELRSNVFTTNQVVAQMER